MNRKWKRPFEKITIGRKINPIIICMSIHQFHTYIWLSCPKNLYHGEGVEYTARRGSIQSSVTIFMRIKFSSVNHLCIFCLVVFCFCLQLRHKANFLSSIALCGSSASTPLTHYSFSSCWTESALRSKPIESISTSPTLSYLLLLPHWQRPEQRLLTMTAQPCRLIKLS